MTFTIITVCYNSADTIAGTLRSVASQRGVNVEHIIVDGGSQDGTLDIIQRYSQGYSQGYPQDYSQGYKQTTHTVRILQCPPRGIFDAINQGILCATGDIIGILHSDDHYASDDVLSSVQQRFLEDETLQGVYADVEFVKRNDTTHITRLYRGKGFHTSLFRFGFMPPHPTFFVKRECHSLWGLYKDDYKDSADFDLMLRFMLHHRMRVHYIDKVLVIMREGGLSTRNLSYRLRQNREILRSCRENRLLTCTPLLWLRYLIKIWQFKL